MANGKGDLRRPQQISKAELERNWERTFGKQGQESKADMESARDC